MPSDYDFIVTSRPVNSTAARVLAKGIHYDRQEGTTFAGHSLAPLPMRKWTGPSKDDLTGTKFGLFVVLGYSATSNGRWVCRCQCGAYEIRKSKSIKNPENAEVDRCVKCRDLAYLKRHAKWIASGRRD